MFVSKFIGTFNFFAWLGRVKIFYCDVHQVGTSQTIYVSQGQHQIVSDVDKYFLSRSSPK